MHSAAVRLCSRWTAGPSCRDVSGQSRSVSRLLTPHSGFTTLARTARSSWWKQSHPTFSQQDFTSSKTISCLVKSTPGSGAKRLGSSSRTGLTEVVARASKPSVFQNRFEVQLPDRRLVLRKPSAWSWNRRFALFDGEKQIGSIDPVGLFTRRTMIDLPDNWSLPIRVFLFWLAVIIWKRQSAAAAS